MRQGLGLRYLPVVCFGVLALFFLRGLSLDPQHLPSARLGQPLPEFSIPVLEGENRYFSSKTMQGHAVMLHVWASWCAVCAEEQVFLFKLKDKGVPLYGLNYKDSPSEATRWLQTWGNPYALSGMDLDGHVGLNLGVYGTPETFLIDKEGVIRYRHVGALNADAWENILLPKWQAIT
jgi:cytochrome c biogenesis protein CcmG, thiol:disulfide interchange protein DsbE